MADLPIELLLDPGHDKAKYNKGAVPGYWEGERMWQLSLYQKEALEARGFIVRMTKNKCDQAITVTQRGAMARGYKALISNHSNAESTGKVDRPVGIYFVDDDCSSIDEESKKLAKLLSDTVAEVMGTSPAQQYSKLSKRDRDHDGYKNDDYYGVLFAAHQAGTPAIILEHSFHTNKRAAQWLMSNANLRKLAEAEADALAKYYNVTPAPVPAKKEGYTVKMQTLKPGSKHAHVKVMQALLIGLGYSCGKSGADGSFGPATKTALGKYQEDHTDPKTGKPLKKDYSCGPATWRSLLAQ